jgi:hypothetical protein
MCIEQLKEITLESPSQLYSAIPLASNQDDTTSEAHQQAEHTLVEVAKHDRAAFAALYQQYYAGCIAICACAFCRRKTPPI